MKRLRGYEEQIKNILRKAWEQLKKRLRKNKRILRKDWEVAKKRWSKD